MCIYILSGIDLYILICWFFNSKYYEIYSCCYYHMCWDLCLVISLKAGKSNGHGNWELASTKKAIVLSDIIMGQDLAHALNGENSAKTTSKRSSAGNSRSLRASKSTQMSTLYVKVPVSSDQFCNFSLKNLLGLWFKLAY